MKNGELMAKEIYQSIKNDLLELLIQDGDFLTLSNLAEKYGVSKTPIRDALNELEKDGYLRSLPRKGYLVVPLSQNDVREYIQMRFILEGAAAQLAAKYANDSELEEILNISCISTSNVSVSEFNQSNTLFHMSIIKAAHNSLMVDISKNIMEKLSRVMLHDSMNIDLLYEQQEHQAIAHALKDRDGERANDLMVKHIAQLQDRIYKTNHIRG